jgi:hypothetical protein
MTSRQASAASLSTCAVAAAPRAPCTTSPGRSSVFDGIHGPVPAPTTDELSFDDGDAKPTLGERSGTVLTGGSSTDDDDVIVDTAIAHLDLMIPLHPGFFGSSGPYPTGSSEWLDQSATPCPTGRRSPTL